MVVVHHLNSSRSWRVLWLLEELGVAYEVKHYERDRSTMRAPAELRAVHPLGKSPVVTDGDTVIAETGAIVEYLLERHGGGQLVPPQGTAEHLRYRYFLHFAEGTAMPPLLLKLIFAEMPRAPMPFFIKPVVRMISQRVHDQLVGPMLKDVLDFLESELAQRPWFAGEEFSAADIMLSFPIEASAARGGLGASRPRLMQWLEAIRARPAYQRVLSSVGPVAALK